jgi:peroxiredoxin
MIAPEQSVAAPLFSLPSTSGAAVELAAYLGKQPVVLVFYMGDF